MENRAALALRKSGAVGIFDYDLLDNTIVADPVAAVLHSVSVAEARQGTSAETFFNGVVEEDVANVKAALATAIAEGKDLSTTYRVVSPHPYPRWVHSQSSVQRDGDGRVARLSGIVTEVTQQREETRMQDARLQFSDEVRGLNDADVIHRLASKVIGTTLYAIRAGFGYVEPAGDEVDIRADWTLDDAESLVGILKISDFGSFGDSLRKGKAVVIRDVRDDEPS